MVRIYPFALELASAINADDGAGNGSAAFFPFIFDNNPVEGISCLISSRNCGDMACFSAGAHFPDGVNPNRKRLFSSLNLEYDRVTFVKQVHSQTVAQTDSQNPCQGTEADGLVTRDKNIFLSVTVADCLPICLYDTENNGFALLHSGWKGTGIALNALQLMKDTWGTNGEAVAAVLGPCIRSCCYKVDEERAVFFEKEFGTTSAVNFGSIPIGIETLSPDSGRIPIGIEMPSCPVTIKREDEYYLDLQAANIRLLAGAGVRNIAVCTDCTFTDSRLGSFRREGKDFTHMVAMAGYFPGYSARISQLSP